MCRGVASVASDLPRPALGIIVFSSKPAAPPGLARPMTLSIAGRSDRHTHHTHDTRMHGGAFTYDGPVQTEKRRLISLS